MVHNVKETRIKTLLKKTKGENDEVLFHHRFATSTPNVRNACHPFSTKDTYDYEYIGIHNGVVRNTYELRNDHEKRGIKYVSNQPATTGGYVKFNDSEALIYDLAHYFEGKTDKLTAYGTIAFIVVKMNAQGKPRTLYFGTNRKELYMKRTKNNITISSEGDGVLVPNDVLHMFDYDTKELTTAPMNIPSTSTFSPSSSTWNKPSQVGNSSSHSHRPTTSTSEAVETALANQKIRDEIERAYLGNGFGEVSERDRPLDLSAEEEQEIIDMFEEEDDDNVNDYFGYDYDSDFVIKLGSKRNVKKEILSKNNNKHHASLVECRSLLEGAVEEIERLNAMSITANETDEFFTYYGMVLEYQTTLADIADELKNEAQAIAAKEEKSARTIGFQVPSHDLTNSHNELG